MQGLHSFDTDASGSAELPRVGLLRAIRRAQATIEEETTALSGGACADHAEFRHRKDLCLLDLARRAPAFVRPPDDPELMAALRGLKDAIVDNQKTLRCHVNAARKVSAILIKAITDEESDHTYTAVLARRDSRT